MALIPNPSASPEETESYLRLLREIELGKHRDGNLALKHMCGAMRRAATQAIAPPTLTSLEPATATIGEPSFTLRVLGTDFDDESVIVFNGNDEPTTLVSSTEVTTGVNMHVWKAPSAPLPVKVRGLNGESAELTFTFEAAPDPLPDTPEGQALALKRKREEQARNPKDRGGPAGLGLPDDRAQTKGEKARSAAHS